MMFTVFAVALPLVAADNCDNPLCESCCTGSCVGCKGWCETHPDGDCSNCYNGADGAPPCNLRGTQCLGGDGLSCEACWADEPLPTSWNHRPQGPPEHGNITAARAKVTQDDCRTDIKACESCCTGSCSNCRGWCEDHPDDDNCLGCYTPSPGAPPCNGRGCQCMHADGLGCELCWEAPPPSPTPTPTPSPSPSPSPTGCPGGSFPACITACPSDPMPDFTSCLNECQRRCDSTSGYAVPSRSSTTQTCPGGSYDVCHAACPTDWPAERYQLCDQLCHDRCDSESLTV